MNTSRIDELIHTILNPTDIPELIESDGQGLKDYRDAIRATVEISNEHQNPGAVAKLIEGIRREGQPMLLGKALSKMREPKAIEALNKALKKPRKKDYNFFLGSLHSIKDEQLKRLYEENLSNEKESMTIRMTSLDGYISDEALEKALENEQIRTGALEEIKGSQPSEAIQQSLLARLEKGKRGENFTEELAKKIAENGIKGREALAKLFTDSSKDTDHRLNAAMGLSVSLEPEQDKAVLSIFDDRDEDPELRIRAIELLCQHGNNYPEALVKYLAPETQSERFVTKHRLPEYYKFVMPILFDRNEPKEMKEACARALGTTEYLSVESQSALDEFRRRR